MPDEGKCSSTCEEGTSLPGYDLVRHVKVPNLDACFEHCKTIPGAKFLEYWINNSCLCKSSDAGRKKTDSTDPISCPIY